ncbi:MAG: GH92 family glycosyl hydrolase [Bacteroidales bacterium]|nr:GH92 family glycosyl hydrolase [Bacteroidales bacterium]
MKKFLPKFFAVFLLAASFSACQNQDNKELKDKNYTQFVNPFIGAADNGHTFPGACVPFGMIQTSPDTGFGSWRYCSGYNFEDSFIYGFSQTHLNGTGCVDLANILVLPFSGEKIIDKYGSSFDKAQETASPGYYSVNLKDFDVKAELTATQHVAFHRYTFNSDNQSNLLVNMQHGMVWNMDQYESNVVESSYNFDDEYTLSGYIKSSIWVEQKIFFVMKFDHKIADSQVLEADSRNKAPKLVLSFPEIKKGEQLLMKVAVSTVSQEGAKKNMDAELSNWDFENTVALADKSWNDMFKRIDVQGTPDEMANFYTSFYHSLIQPNNIADVDGQYRGADDSIHISSTRNFYSTISAWDTYRAAHPFYTLVMTDYVGDMVNSLVEQSQIQGFLPIWGLWGKENYCMIGNHSVPIIVEAYLKGIEGIDAEKAYTEIKKSLTVSHRGSDWETYDKYGYYPTDKMKTESVSKTLECAYDDYAAAQMASKLGKSEDQDFFNKRSMQYKNLFDSQTLFMRPKNSDGTWKSPFNPSQLAHSESIGGDYTEGNAWQYTWHVQHDPMGLIELFPSKDEFINKLDSLFTIDLSKYGQSLSDVTGLIGMYAHGNEPSHHVTYLYSLAGKPERTQELIRQIFDMHYKNKPDGLCGNDDCGQMSAWYMFNAMGFYPLNPVSGEYIFGAPQISSITLNLTNGNKFEIVANNLSKENLYIDSIELNGKPYTKNTISHSDIMKGGKLIYNMRAKK